MKNIPPFFSLFFLIPFLGYSQNSINNTTEDDIEYEEVDTKYKSIFDEQTFEIEYPKTLKLTNNFNEIEDNKLTKNIIESKFTNTKQTPANTNNFTNPRIKKKSILRKISGIKKS